MTAEERYAIQNVPYYKGYVPGTRQMNRRIPYFQQLKEKVSEENAKDLDYKAKNIWQVIIPPVKFIPGYTGHLPGKNDVFGKTFTQQVEECLKNLAKIRKMNEEKMERLEGTAEEFNKQIRNTNRPASCQSKGYLDKSSISPQSVYESRPETSRFHEKSARVQFGNRPSTSNYTEHLRKPDLNTDDYMKPMQKPDLSINNYMESPVRNTDLSRIDLETDRRPIRPETPREYNSAQLENRTLRDPEKLFEDLKYMSPFSRKSQYDVSRYNNKYDPNPKNSETKMQYTPGEGTRNHKWLENDNVYDVDHDSGCNPDNPQQECNYRISSPTKLPESRDDDNFNNDRDNAERKAINPSYDFSDHHQKDYKPEIDQKDMYEPNDNNQTSDKQREQQDYQLDHKSVDDLQLSKDQDASNCKTDYDVANNPQLSSTREHGNYPYPSYDKGNSLLDTEKKADYQENLNLSERRPSTGLYSDPKNSRYLTWNDYVKQRGIYHRTPNFYRTTYDDFNNAVKYFNSNLNSQLLLNRGYKPRLRTGSYLGIPPL